MRYQRRDMRQFGRFRSQKFLARRRIEKEIADRDRRPEWQPRFFDADHLAAIDFEHRPGGFFFGAGFQMQSRDRSDRRQRLAAKSQRRNAQQIVGFFDFRGRMALEGQHGIVAHHPTTVVGDLDQFLSARLDLYANARGTGVQRVLQQLLHHRRGTLHHLAGGDLVGNSFGEDVNFTHVDSVQCDRWEGAA